MASLFQEIKSLRTLFADSLPYFLLSLTLFSCFCDMMLKETINDFQTRSKIRKLLELQIYYNRILTMDFTKNTNLSIEEISENKTSGNELSVTKISDSTAEKTFTNNAFSHFVTDTMTILWEPADSGCRLLQLFWQQSLLNVQI